MRLELTRRADYAIRAVTFLARATDTRVIAGPRIADAMGIPSRFLPQVMADLARAGIVQATLGRSGGYRLARDPSELSVLQVIEAIEGDARRRTCVLRTGGCDPTRPCDVHSTFSEAQDALLDRLARTTIGEIVDQRRRRPATDPHSRDSMRTRGSG
jgi:Rrf2 family protein